MTFWCVGRNYADHAKELGNAVPTSPLFFIKAGSCLTLESNVRLPDWAEDVHHELEIALQFDHSLNLHQVALALDLTERSLQSRLKKEGQPWTLAKSFINACPMSQSVPLVDDLEALELELQVNGETRQKAQASSMIFTPMGLREYALKHFPVAPGDWLLTGTPAGVGPLRGGDRLKAFLTYQRQVLIQMDWRITQ